MREIKLRQSYINSFLRCPEQARQERLGLVRQKETSDLLRGNAVHHAIEHAGLARMNDSRDVSLDEMIDVNDTFIADNANEVEVWRQEYDEVVDTCRANVKCFYDELYPVLDPVGVEETFTRSMGVRHGVQLTLTGTADWNDRSGALWDWKNPSRHYPAWEKQRWDIQSHAYTWALDKTTFNLAVFAKGKLQVIEIHRSQEEKDAFIELCWSIVPTLLTIDTATTWPMRWEGWHCSPKWCPVWQAGKCRGEHLTEDPF